MKLSQKFSTLLHLCLKSTKNKFCFLLCQQQIDLPGSTLDWLVQSLMFVICVATSGLRDVCFMFLFNGSMFPFLFRVLVTLISVYTFFVCYFCGFVTFDLNIFLHLIKKKKKYSSKHEILLNNTCPNLYSCKA